MMTFFRALIASLFLASGIGFASAPAMAAGDSGGGGASNRTVDMSSLVLPVARDGELINYLFVSATVTIAGGFDHWAARENAHVLRDGILREAHRHTVGLAGHPMELNEDAFRAAVVTVFEHELGAGAVEHIDIIATDSQLVFIDG